MEDVVEPWKVNVLKEIHRIWPNVVKNVQLTQANDSPQKLSQSNISPIKQSSTNTVNGVNIGSSSGIKPSSSSYELKKLSNKPPNIVATNSSNTMLNTSDYVTKNKLLSLDPSKIKKSESPVSLNKLIAKVKPLTVDIPEDHHPKKPRKLISEFGSSKFRMTYLDNDTSKAVIEKENRMLSLRFKTQKNSVYDSVFFGTIINAKFLTTTKASNHVIHVEIKLPNQYQYKTGDVLCIYAPNPEYLVNRLLRRLKLNGKSVIKIHPISVMLTSKVLPHIPNESSVYNIFRYCIDIRAIPNKFLVKQLSSYCEDENDRESMLELYNQPSRIKNGTIIELLEQFPSCKVSLKFLLEYLPALKPRPYSICNSEFKYPNVCHICLRILKHTDDDSKTAPSPTNHVFNDNNIFDDFDEYKDNSNENDKYTPNEESYLDGLCSTWLYNICRENDLFRDSKRIKLGRTVSTGNLNKLHGFKQNAHGQV